MLVSAQKCAETAAAARVSSPSREMGPVMEAPDSAGQREIERGESPMRILVYDRHTHSRGCWCSTCVCRGRIHMV